MAEKSRKKGHGEALTGDDPGAVKQADDAAAAKGNPVRRQLDRDRLAAAIAELLPGQQPQPELFEVADSLEAMAELANAQRRGSGRPKGAANRRNDDLWDYLDAMGYKNPAVRLMEIVSAPPAALLTDRAEALKLQIRAAEALLPYMMARKPQQIDLNKRAMHMFIAASMEVAGLDGEEFLGQLLDANEIKELAVRDRDNVSHGAEESQPDQGLTTAEAAVQKSAADPRSSP